MELKPIKTKAEYKAALREVEALFDAPEKSPEADRLEVLTMLVEKYEAQHYPIPAPDPIDFLNYAMETRGLTRKDLEQYIGSRGRVAEVLNRARPPSADCGLRIAAGRIEFHRPPCGSWRKRQAR